MKIYVTKINETKLRKESLLFLIFIDIRINYLLNISIFCHWQKQHLNWNRIERFNIDKQYHKLQILKKINYFVKTLSKYVKLNLKILDSVNERYDLHLDKILQTKTILPM